MPSNLQTYTLDSSRRYSLKAQRIGLWVSGLSLLFVAIALFTQHVMGMQPCPWCIVQRLIYLLIGLVTPAVLLFSTPAVRINVFGIAAALCMAGLCTAGYQQFVAAQSNACGLTAADRFLINSGLENAMPWLFEARAGCKDANAPLLFLPYAVWSMVAFTVLLVLSYFGVRNALKTR